MTFAPAAGKRPGDPAEVFMGGDRIQTGNVPAAAGIFMIAEHLDKFIHHIQGPSIHPGLIIAEFGQIL